MKLVFREEAETPAPRDWLDSEPEVPAVTSELGRAEVLRAARQAGEHAFTEARAVIGDVDLVPSTEVCRISPARSAIRRCGPSTHCIWRPRCSSETS